MQFLKKVWKMWENVEISSLWQPKQQGIISCFSKDFFATEIKNTNIYEWTSLFKPNYEERAKLCYLDTDGFTVYIEKEEMHLGIAKDPENRFHTIA